MINLATSLTGSVWNWFGGCRRHNNQPKAASAASTKPIPTESSLLEIAAAVGKKHFSEAIKLTATLPEKDGLRERVEEIVLLPFHKFFHRDFNLACRYKELRLLALAGDPAAKEKLKVLHCCGKIIDKLFSMPYIDFGRKFKAVVDNELPYVNLSSGLSINLKKTKDNTYSAEITFENKVYNLPTSKETKFLIFLRLREGNDKCIGIFEGKNIEGKLDFQIQVFKEGEPDKIAENRGKGPHLSAIDFDQSDDFDKDTVRKIIDFMKKNFSLYRNDKSKSSVIEYANEFSIFPSPDFKAVEPAVDEGNLQKLFWIPDRCAPFKITMGGLNVRNEFRSFFDPNGLRYSLENDALRVTAIAEDERKWVVDNGYMIGGKLADSGESAAQLKAAMEKSFSIQFEKRPWQEAAPAYMQCHFKDMDRLLTKDESSEESVPWQCLLQFEKNPQRYCLLLGNFRESYAHYINYLCFGENGHWGSQHWFAENSPTISIAHDEYQLEFGNDCVVKKSVERDVKITESNPPKYSIQMHRGGEFEPLTLVSNDIPEADSAFGWHYGLQKHLHRYTQLNHIYNTYVCFNRPRLWFSFKLLALESFFGTQNVWRNLTPLIHAYDTYSVDDQNRAEEIGALN